MTANIFISHISEESDVAQTLKECISKDWLGLTDIFVSSDLSTIKAGKKWLDAIEEGLAKADLLLVLCSPRSIARPWVNFEAGAAWLKGVPIVPICHSGMRLTTLPMPLAILQGVELIDPNGLKRLYHLILETLGAKAVPERDFEALASKLSALQHIDLPPPLAGASKVIAPPNFLDDATLKRAIDHANFGWTLCFIGEDQSDKMAQLTQDLEEGCSTDGNGKRFASGFSYWGIGPTLAWARACTDPLYRVAKRGIELFPTHWKRCSEGTGAIAHYVSLGVGTGEKDRIILRRMLSRDPRTYFFPVDMSGEMLRVGIAECRKNEDLKRSQILPIQIDFSNPENAAAVWSVVTSVAGDHPVLYSLLGNTLANFDEDLALLQLIAAHLRQEDKLLLELATTVDVSQHAAERAAAEYRRSDSFNAFATSALNYHTSIQIDQDCVEFLPSYVADGAIEVRVVYRNRSADRFTMKVTSGRHVVVEPDETIRLYLSRKYRDARILEMIDSIGCRAEIVSRSTPDSDGFASTAVLLSPKG